MATKSSTPPESPRLRVGDVHLGDPVGQHDREEHQHEDAADVDEQLGDGHEVGGEEDVERARAEQRAEQADGAVEDVAREGHARGAGHGHGRDDVEEDVGEGRPSAAAAAPWPAAATARPPIATTVDDRGGARRRATMSCRGVRCIDGARLGLGLAAVGRGRGRGRGGCGAAGRRRGRRRLRRRRAPLAAAGAAGFAAGPAWRRRRRRRLRRLRRQVAGRPRRPSGAGVELGAHQRAERRARVVLGALRHLVDRERARAGRPSGRPGCGSYRCEPSNSRVCWMAPVGQGSTHRPQNMHLRLVDVELGHDALLGVRRVLLQDDLDAADGAGALAGLAAGADGDVHLEEAAVARRQHVPDRQRRCGPGTGS